MNTDPKPANRPLVDGDFWQTKSLEELATEQDVSPVATPEELKADFWPEDESCDEFIATVREWRREGVRDRRASPS